MKETPLEHRIKTIATPLAADMGLEIVCVSIIGEGGGRNVQIMAENPETRRLGLDECASLSKSLSALLDVEDPIDGTYRLEVSSPGIDRPLVKLTDFEIWSGFEARLEIAAPNDRGQRRFRGILKGLKGESILIETDQGQEELAFADLTKAKLVLNDELIKKTSTV